MVFQDGIGKCTNEIYGVPVPECATGEFTGRRITQWNGRGYGRYRNVRAYPLLGDSDGLTATPEENVYLFLVYNSGHIKMTAVTQTQGTLNWAKPRTPVDRYVAMSLTTYKEVPFTPEVVNQLWSGNYGEYETKGNIGPNYVWDKTTINTVYDIENFKFEECTGFLLAGDGDNGNWQAEATDNATSSATGSDSDHAHERDGVLVAVAVLAAVSLLSNIILISRSRSAEDQRTSSAGTFEYEGGRKFSTISNNDAEDNDAPHRRQRLTVTEI